MRWLARSLGLSLLVLAAVLALWGGTGNSQAAAGNNLRQFTAQVAPCTTTSSGIAFDGSILYLSCWGSNVLERVSPANGASLGPITISGIPDVAAMAWDPSRGELWACSFQNLYLIDVGAKTATKQFSVANAAVNQCFDGLSFDRSDGTLWISCSFCGAIDHYTTAGVLIKSFPVSISMFGGFQNSGIVATGSHLYVANQYGGQIFECAKDLSSCSPFASFAAKLEDLECDDVTFAPKTAIWSQDGFDRMVNAWEISDSGCGAAAPPAPTSTPTMVATATPPAATATPTVTAVPPTATAVPPTATTVPPTATATATTMAAISTPLPSATPVAPVVIAPATAAPRVAAAQQPAVGVAGVRALPNSGSGPGGGRPWPLIALAIAAGLALIMVGLRMRRPVE